MRLNRLLISLILLNACEDKSTDAVTPTDSGAAEGEGEGEGEGEVDDCPSLALTTMSLQLDHSAVGEANEGVILISNSCTGNYPLVFTPALSADSSSTFSIPTDRVTVPPGTEASLVVTFTPPDFTAYTATINIDSNDTVNPSVSIPIYGIAVSDADEDGYDSPAAGGPDCDDSDATVYPGAEETWYDGTDADCAGDSDFDQDTDGYDSDAYGGDDCDDSSDDVYPGARDTWYDGVDSDCADNDDYDKDGDGQASEDYRGQDCDDSDADIYYGADETPYDGVDQDCDGKSDYDADEDGFDSPTYGGDDCDDTDPDSNPDATDVWDDVDNDCDDLLDEDAVAAGDVLVTEVMSAPLNGSTTYGEWFELYNDSAMDIDLYGWKIYEDDEVGFDIDEHLTLASAESIVLGVSADTTRNGDYTPDYVYTRSDFKLNDTGDQIIVSVEGRTIVEFNFNSSWGVTSGYALQLDKDKLDDSFMDDSTVWCDASATFGDGDYGTPGYDNSDCR